MCRLVFGVIPIITTLIFLRFRILADISAWFILAIIKIWSGELFFFFHFFNKIHDGRRITWEATYPGHMLIRFWCDSEITFSSGLHKNLVTVLYFSIIIVLCGAGGDASFAPQANLAQTYFKSQIYFYNNNLFQVNSIRKLYGCPLTLIFLLCHSALSSLNLQIEINIHYKPRIAVTIFRITVAILHV